MFGIMDKSTHEEHLSQPLQSPTNRFKLAITFPTVYKGIFNVTNKDKKIQFHVSI